MNGKPNAAGKAGAIFNIIVAIIVILFSILGLAFFSTVDVWVGWQIVSQISYVSIIVFLIYLSFGLYMLIGSIKFMKGAGNKLSLGIISILTGFGIISGILILVSSPEE